MRSQSVVPVIPKSNPVSEVMWRLNRQGADWQCELHPQPEGVEAVILRNGLPVVVRRFQMPDMAAMWAAMEREDL